MPSLEQLLLSSPVGFVSGCSHVNKKAEDYDEYKHMTSNIFLSLKKGNFADNKNHDDSSALISTLNFLARSCLSATPKVDASNLLNVLGLCTSLSDESIQGIVSGFESVQEVKASQEDHTSHLGRLFDLKWKLGVAVSSSCCSNLSAPFVALSYKICDSNGKAQGYTMELSFTEFQEFLAKMKGIAAHMDSL